MNTKIKKTMAILLGLSIVGGAITGCNSSSKSKKHRDRDDDDANESQEIEIEVESEYFATTEIIAPETEDVISDTEPVETEVEETEVEETEVEETNPMATSIRYDENGVAHLDFHSISKYMRGNPNIRQLEFVLTMAEFANVYFDGNTSAIKKNAVRYIQYVHDGGMVYKCVEEDKEKLIYKYDLNAINELLSVAVDEPITDADMGSWSHIEGDLLVCEDPRVASGFGCQVGIADIRLNESNQIEVDYYFDSREGSDGLTGSQGHYIAIMDPDENGLYHITSYVEVERFHYSETPRNAELYQAMEDARAQYH